MGVDGTGSYSCEIESCFVGGGSSVNPVVCGLRFGGLEGFVDIYEHRVSHIGD